MLELLDGARVRSHEVTEIDLHDLGARAAASVGEGAGGADHAVRPVGELVQRQVGVGEGRVAQAVAEREERVGAVIQVVGGIAVFVTQVQQLLPKDAVTTDLNI